MKPDSVHQADERSADLLLVEIRDLKDTIAAMRDQIESSRTRYDSELQQAMASATAEIAQLKAAVGAAREALEQERHQHETARQEMARAMRDEAAQLQATIVALREQLEQPRAGTRPG
jgi:chromosome segregation ATPase